MKRVLLPIDGSECALRGVALIISKRGLYAKPEELDIHLVNVQAPFSSDISRFVSHEQVEAFHREQGETMTMESRKMLDAAGVKYTCHYEIGPVAETIVQLADSLRCDQIVMGAHGRGGFADLLMGSITQKVLHLTTIPVLLVK